MLSRKTSPPAAPPPPTAQNWRENFPMSRLSSWRAGGAASWLFAPQSEAQLAAALPTAAELLPVGYGSNLLVRDGGYDGVALHTAALSDLREEEDGRVYAAAGVGCPKLARFCAGRGFAGGEFFVGIPGTVGGALAMNAGCYGGETWRHVDAVAALLPNGDRVVCKRGEFSPAYRRLPNPRGLLFVGCWLVFERGEAAAAQAKTRELLRRRAQTQPLGEPSAGSVFCNPPNKSAGQLLEQCGLKGERVGGAQVSCKHANFIVNADAASAADIEALIERMERRVLEQTGERLRREVRIVGRA